MGEEWVRSQAQISVQQSVSLGEEATRVGQDEGASTQSLLGTYKYMSPEQKRGEEANERSDIYALGLMIYKLLTGRNLGMKKPSEIDRELVPDWDELTAMVLEENADDRPRDCGKR